MRSIDATLQARIELAQQTLYNNANPQMDVQVTRPRTPITRAGFWQESIVTEGATAVCTSVAVRRQVKNPTRAYVAYVTSGGTLVVKWADLSLAWESMVWTTIETISGCVACAVEFDGSFVRAPRNRVEYLTDATPWLFYVTDAGALMGGPLGDTYETLVGANVTSVDAIRGVASLYKDEDQGLLLFYIIAGNVYYRPLIAGEWGSQGQVTIAPADAVKIKAERVWDWRIVLQVTETGGALYEVYSKMQASGWNGLEFIELVGATAFGEMFEITYWDFQAADEYLEVTGLAEADNKYTLSPVFIEAFNIDDGNGDFGYWIRLRFDERVWNTTGNESAFKFVDNYGFSWYAQEIINEGRWLSLRFNNFNNAGNPVTLSYTPGTITGDIENLAADSIQLTLANLVPYYVEPPIPQTLSNLQEWEVGS